MSIARPSLTDVVIWAGAAASGDISTPTTSQQGAGFTDTPAAPPKEWFNWIQKFVSSCALYLMGRGISDYDATLDYGTNDTVRGTDGKVYESKGYTPAGNAPPNGTYWRIFGVGWIEDALKTSLAASLPALMLSSIKTLLGVQIAYSDAGAATFDCGGLRINVATLTLNVSNGNVTTTTFNWRAPFGLIFGALANQVSDADIIVSTAPTPTACTVVPRGSSAGAAVFVVGFGTTPSS